MNDSYWYKIRNSFCRGSADAFFNGINIIRKSAELKRRTLAVSVPESDDERDFLHAYINSFYPE